MTVRELIAALGALPEDARDLPVAISTGSPEDEMEVVSGELGVRRDAHPAYSVRGADPRSYVTLS